MDELLRLYNEVIAPSAGGTMLCVAWGTLGLLGLHWVMFRRHKK